MSAHHERRNYKKWLRTKRPRLGYADEGGNRVIAQAIRRVEAMPKLETTPK